MELMIAPSFWKDCLIHLCNMTEDQANRRIEAVTEGTRMETKYCFKCGSELRQVESGFTHTVKIWWCDGCKDEIDEPMRNKPPIWSSDVNLEDLLEDFDDLPQLPPGNNPIGDDDTDGTGD